MKASKVRDVETVIALLIAQAPPLTLWQEGQIRDALHVGAPRTCERRPAQAAAAPADPAPQHSAGGS